MSEMPYDEFVASLPSRFPRKVKPSKPRAKRRKKPSTTAHLRIGELAGHEYMAADPCVYCGGPASQWDHVEPLYRGGQHSGDNLARTCWSCNKAKNSQPLLVFLARRAAA